MTTKINQPSDGTCGYIAFYDNKRLEVYANSSYQAQQTVANHFKVKPKNHHRIVVALAEINNQPYQIPTNTI